MPAPRVRVRLASPWLLLALTTCTPRVPATLELDEPPPSEPAKRGTEREPVRFSVAHALDISERALLAIDKVRGRENPSDFDYDRAQTWLPDAGLRSLYYYASGFGLTLGAVGELFDAPVYLDGPHGGEPELSALTYGVYNPEFVERLGETARALGNDPARVERTRAAYRRQLREQALTYLWVYQALHDNPDWFDGYRREHSAQLRQVAAGEWVDWSASPYWRDTDKLVSQFYSRGRDWAETATAMTFWVRRDLDGTAGLWHDALEALVTAYGDDPRAAIPYLVPG